MSDKPKRNLASHQTRCRAKMACKICNARRVRCNVVESQPCDNCVRAGVPCEILRSRRGKCVFLFQGLLLLLDWPLVITDNNRHDRRVNTANRAAQHRPLSPADSTSMLAAYERPSDTVVEDTSNYTQNFSSPDDRFSDNVRNTPRSLPQGGTSSTTLTTAQDAIQSPATSMSGPESTVFLGESNSITTFRDPERSAASHNRGLQYSIPDTVSAKTATTPLETRRRATKVETLSWEGAFSFPPKDSCEMLFRAYFSWFHPCFPIIERARFCNSYTSKTTSPLLLQAMLFIGASYCTENILRSIGLSDRHDTRSTFYNHAKDIYDADYETDKVTVCQALFLISFWRAGPLLEKDTRHWLGAAISLAQTKGMHRS